MSATLCALAFFGTMVIMKNAIASVAIDMLSDLFAIIVIYCERY
jgi:hypothetical protein